MTDVPTLYLFDVETGEYRGTKPARMSPLEPDVPLIPRAATLVAPPEPVPGYARCWRDGEWVLIEDHRGQTVYSTEDGREIVIKELGPLPENVTTQPRPSERHVWQDGAWKEEPTLDDYRYAIQTHIDATAQERQYDSGVSCATYVNSTNPQWAAEAAAFVAWRDAVWSYAFTELEKVLNEQRPQPTIDEFLSELPAMQWPEPE